MNTLTTPAAKHTELMNVPPKRPPEKMSLADQINAIEVLKPRVSGSPTCHRSGCWGRGYTGIVIVRDTTQDPPVPAVKLLLCECGQIGKNEYAHLQDFMNERIEAIVKTQTDLLRLVAMDLVAKMDEVGRDTFFRGLSIRAGKIRAAFTRRPKGESHAPHS